MKKSMKSVVSGIMALSMVSGMAAVQPAAQAVTSPTALAASADTAVSKYPKVSYITGNGKVKLTWTAVEVAEKYAVVLIRGGERKVITQTTDTSYVFSGLNAGEQYKVGIAFKWGTQWELWAASTITVTPKAEAPEPAIHSEVQDGRFRIRWEAVQYAEAYAVGIQTAAGWQLITTTAANERTYTSPAGALSAGTYNVAVVAKINGRWDTSDIKFKTVSITIPDSEYAISGAVMS